MSRRQLRFPFRACFYGALILSALAAPISLSAQTISVLPSTGSGGSATFAVTVNDSNGASDLNSIWFLINNSSATTNACYLRYDRATNLMYLADNSGAFSAGGVAVGALGYLQNSQCLLRTDTSTVTISSVLS